MSQSRFISLVEAGTNVAVGYLLALTTQFAVSPMPGVDLRTRKILLIGLAFTGVSIVRSHLLRRLFDSLAYRERGDART
ncbi:hypothetical protein DDZ14_14950 [Maritimibacter sp. 55A14]|uniref:DUF7220 family protein n=1 Tax=Maritimibacter sp. 55A14 TaxID=2174844 RepID=UPI000D615112|nr:hypothetical protein [Maritimibacter sp. 55A14]PWE30583.1 hypothetical protein DDZ14_14950 [Maritimibacter sp. 55A14]